MDDNSEHIKYLIKLLDEYALDLMLVRLYELEDDAVVESLVLNETTPVEHRRRVGEEDDRLSEAEDGAPQVALLDGRLVRAFEGPEVDVVEVCFLAEARHSPYVADRLDCRLFTIL